MLNMTGTGWMIHSMGMEKRCGTMALPDIRGSSTKARKMVTVDLTGRMGATMKDSSLMVILRDLEHTILLILTRHILGNSGEATWRAEVLNLGQMVDDMRVTLRTVKRTEKVPLNGQMETNISEAGAMANNME